MVRLVIMAVVLCCLCVSAKAQGKDSILVMKMVTVVKHYKVAATEQGHADTVLSAYAFDANKQTIDVYFCLDHFQMPHVLPTVNLYNSPDKQKECDLTQKPEKVKCYKYDKSGRVTEMHVGGRGFNTVWTYKFNKRNQLVSIDQAEDQYTIEYNAEGNIKSISVMNYKVEKLLEFTYE